MPRGRPPSAKTLVDRQLGRNIIHPILPAGDGFIIPNHSGDHSEGRVDSTPVDHLDLVNKKYVDDQATVSAVQLFMTKDASDVTDYFDLDSSPDTGAEQTITTSCAGGNVLTTVAEHVSILNDEVVSAIELIESGVYFCHMHPSSTANKKTFLCCTFHKRTAAGGETEIGVTEEVEMGTSESEFNMHVLITSDTAWTSTDRFVMKTICRNANASSKDVTIRMKDDNFSRVEFPAFIAPTFVADHASAHEVGGGDLVDHDLLTNFVAAEHVDWAGASAGTIHATNYVDNDTVTTVSDSSTIDFTLTGVDITASTIDSAIDHDSLLNFTQTEHFTEASIDHVNIANIGTNTHAQIDTHIALSNEHIDWTSTSSNFSTSGTLAAGATTITGDATATGNIGVGTTSMIAKVSIQTADQSATISSAADELLLEGASPGMTFFGGTGTIAFGDAGSNVAGVIQYSHTSNEMVFNINATAQVLGMSSTEAVFNEIGADTNFRVESDTKTHMLFVDAGSNEVGIDTSNPVTTLDVNGGLALAIVAKTEAYTATSSDHTILCSAVGDFTVTLPAASGLTGFILNIKNIGISTITVDGNSSETIDGSLTQVLSTQYQGITIHCDGSNWHILQ